MIYFITYSEKYNGIYSSQVIDVCKKLENISNQKVKLLSLVSLRDFRSERKKIKTHYKNSLVFPMFPKIQFWKLNIFTLIPIFIFKKNNILISRNAIATNLGFSLRKLGLVKRVVFDARAAEFEQFKEYKIIDNKSFVENFFNIEKKAVISSDSRIVVSNKLIKFWNNKFNYNDKNHLIIPSTLNTIHLSKSKIFARKKIGFSDTDIIFVYSGSSSKWQSFSKMFLFVEKFLLNNTKYKLLILSKETTKIKEMIKKFPNQISVKWLNTNDVIPFLKICDYGLIIRDESITNQVSSPVKFAEYLYAGLKIIISSNIGDYSKFVLDNDCGFLDNQCKMNLKKVTNKQKKFNSELALNYFSKNSPNIENKYKKLLKI